MGEAAEWKSVLNRLVAYDDKHGYMYTVIEYNPFGCRAAALNYEVPSIFGTVDVDWMLRIAWVAHSEFVAWVTFRTAKFYWNLIDPRRGKMRNRLDPSSIMGSANERAVNAAHAWATDKSLREIFGPALR